MHALTGYDRRLQAGVYDVAENLSVHALLQLFASGKVQQHPVRIPEGATLVQLLPKLRSEEVLEQSIEDIAGLSDRLNLELPSLEGAFFQTPILCLVGHRISACCSVLTMR